jgi:hypothetical protein
LIQQHKLAQLQQRQQQLLQPFAQIQPSQIGISRQPQLRPPLAQPGIAGPIRTPVDTGLCSRRLMQYLYHKCHRPEVCLCFCTVYIHHEITRCKPLAVQFIGTLSCRIIP